MDRAAGVGKELSAFSGRGPASGLSGEEKWPFERRGGSVSDVD